MSHPIRAGEVNYDFKWGLKRGMGGKNRDLQFYESFTYDGVEYFLYDSVYLYQTGQLETYIGKLVRIWETPTQEKKVKIVWFFRPGDIRQFFKDVVPQWNEIFLASGEGKGLSNINSLEALGGKCNVVCTSNDKRNPRASQVELREADYIFYRTFDVGSLKISDNFPVLIDGIKVECFFNRKKEQKCINPPNIKATLEGRTRAVSPISKSESNKVLDRIAKDGNFAYRKSLEASLGKQGCPRAFMDGAGTGGISCSQTEDNAKRKYTENSLDMNALENRPLKKRKLLYGTGKPNISALSVLGEKSNTKTLLQSQIGSKNSTEELAGSHLRLSESEAKNQETKDSIALNRGLSKRVKFDEKATKVPNKLASQPAQNQGINARSDIVDVTRRPDADTKSWFKELPWDKRIQRAHEQGTLVLLENLDPSYSSSEVEDLVWHAFNVRATAKMIECGTFSSPHNGEAFVIFKTKATADMVIYQLDIRCLMLTGGRPVVGCRKALTDLSKTASFIGHLSIDKIRFQRHKYMKNAVSTSHYSQPNTIEFDLAIEWRALQLKSGLWWKALHQQQAKEIQDLKSQLKHVF